MKIENRVFFESEAEAMDAGYRPCGNCMRNRVVMAIFFIGLKTDL
jgi:methylphosphotriester-DNA--protein-cysteine methyltransferase